MKRTLMGLVLPAVLAVGGLAAPTNAAGQLSVDLHLSWHWGGDGWRSQPFTYGPRDVAYYGPAPRPGRYGVPRAALRIPPGHLPPPGMCRLWYVGRPPGHQPPATSCARLFRSYRQTGVVILQGPPRKGRAWHAPGRGKGKPGRGRGRGGGA